MASLNSSGLRWDHNVGFPLVKKSVGVIQRTLPGRRECRSSVLLAWLTIENYQDCQVFAQKLLPGWRKPAGDSLAEAVRQNQIALRTAQQRYVEGRAGGAGVSAGSGD